MPNDQSPDQQASDPIVKEPLYWDYDFPVLSLSMLKQIAMPLVGVPLFLATLLIGYSLYEGVYMPVLGVYLGALGFSIFLGLCYLLAAALTGNRLKVGYVITDQGLISATIGAGKNGASVLGNLLLALSDDMTMQGIGLLAQRRDAKFTPWEKVSEISPAGPRKDFKLLNSKGRMIGMLRAEPEDYDRILRTIKRIMANQKKNT